MMMVILMSDQTSKRIEQAKRLLPGITLSTDEIYSRALPEVESYVVISDHLIDRLPDPVHEMYYHAWQAENGHAHVHDAVKKLLENIPQYAIQSYNFNLYLGNKYYAPVLFIGLFIGLVFFASAGSFLYFRLYADLDGDKQKFQAIGKLGLSERELRKVLTRQIAILFFAPIIVALIHGAVALTALSHMFYHNMFVESVTVLGVFLLIQLIYFFVVRYFYTAQIKASIA